MRIKRAMGTLLEAAAVCSLLGWLLSSVGCNGTAISTSDGGAVVTNSAPRVDWGMSLLAGGTVGVGQFPAKFTFDVNAAPDCTNDFVVYNTSLGGSASKANIVAFNELYSTQGSSGGLCSQNGPSVYWSYFTGTGKALTSTALSEDGTKVAFVENIGAGAILRILKWKASEGTGTATPHAVDQDISGSAWSTCTAGNSCVASIAFGNGNQDTNSAPFVDYNGDNLYVGDDKGVLHKFTGVFKGTPAEVTTGGWPITVDNKTVLTSPVYDSVSGNIFVGDDSGRLSFVREVGSTQGTCTAPCLDTANLQVGNTGGASAVVDAPIVDGTTGMVFAVNGAETTNHGTILQANTALSSSVSFAIGGAGGNPIYSGAFDSTYMNSSKPNIAGHMYVCGKEPGNDRPAVYQLSFAASTGVLTAVGTPLTGLASGSGEACSPVTELDNPNGGGAGTEKDWIFLSIGAKANNVNPIPSGSACRTDTNGCVISIDVTGSPTWPPTTVNGTASVPTNSPGSTSGIVVDNVSTSAQTSSFYFSLAANSTGTGPGLPSCNTTNGVGCAVKLTQLGLQ